MVMCKRVYCSRRQRSIVYGSRYSGRRWRCSSGCRSCRLLCDGGGGCSRLGCSSGGGCGGRCWCWWCCTYRYARTIDHFIGCSQHLPGRGEEKGGLASRFGSKLPQHGSATLGRQADDDYLDTHRPCYLSLAQGVPFRPMHATAGGDHHEDLTGISTATGSRREHCTSIKESEREVMISTSVFYVPNFFGDVLSVGVLVKYEFYGRNPVVRHHAYLYLVWPDVELPDDDG